MILAEGPAAVAGQERIRVVQQDISKWDKNRDGKLTGAERDEFLKDKRKQVAEAEAAARGQSKGEAAQDKPSPPSGP